MSKNLRPWLENYILQIAREYGSALSSTEEHAKPRMLQIIEYLYYPNSHADNRVWALCSDEDLKISVCFSTTAMQSFAASQDPDLRGFGLRNQLRAVVKVRQFRLAFQRIPMPDGMTKDNELFLHVERADIMAAASEEVFNKDNLVSLRKKYEIRRWIHGLRNGNGNILKREAVPQKPPSIVANMRHELDLQAAPPSQQGPSDVNAGSSKAAPDPAITAPTAASDGSTSGPSLKERVRQREELAAARRRARFSKPIVTDEEVATPRLKEPARISQTRERHSVSQASTSTTAQRAVQPKSDPERAPPPPSGSKPPSRRVTNALLSDDPTPVRLRSQPPSLDDEDEDEDDEPSRTGTPRQTTPSDWAPTQSQSPARSLPDVSPDPIPSSDDWMRSSPPHASPLPPPPRSRSPAPVRAGSSSTSHASTARARSPKSSTGSLTLQGKRHTAEPPPVPAPGIQEKVLVPNSDTSLSQSQEKGSQGKAVVSKGSRTKRDRVETSAGAGGRAESRREDNGSCMQKRERRELRDERDGSLGAVEEGSRMPGYFSPTGESKAVEDLIMLDAQDPSTARHPRLYPDLRELDEDDRQIVTISRRSKDKGKGKARQITLPVEEPTHEAPPRSPSPTTTSTRPPNVDLPTLLKKHKRKLSRRSSNIASISESPAKRPRNANEQAQVPEPPTAIQSEHEDTQPTAVQVSASSSSTQGPLISWTPKKPRIPWWTREEDARALAIVREGSALIAQRRQEGHPYGRELTSQERRKYFQANGRISQPPPQ